MSIELWKKNIINAGVSAEHIESEKKDFLVHKSKYKYYYVRNEKEPYKKVIDISKIVGIDTGWRTANISVYDLFFSVTGEIEGIDVRNQLKYERIEENYNSLCKNGLEFQYAFYASDKYEKILHGDFPKFIHYIEDDVYFSNVTHRTVSAKLFNAPSMVGIVHEYEFNKQYYENYLLTNEKFNYWNAFIKQDFNNLRIEEYGAENSCIGLANGFYLYAIDNDLREICKFSSPLNSWRPYICKSTEESNSFCTRIDQIILKIREMDKLIVEWEPSGMEYLKLKLFSLFNPRILRFIYNRFYDNVGYTSSIDDKMSKIALIAKRNYVLKLFNL